MEFEIASALQEIAAQSHCPFLGARSGPAGDAERTLLGEWLACGAPANADLDRQQGSGIAQEAGSQGAR
ncbi:MAG: hypothetical protein V3V08_19040 [Nannocystaceae bacterium]